MIKKNIHYLLFLAGLVVLSGCITNNYTDEMLADKRNKKIFNIDKNSYNLEGRYIEYFVVAKLVSVNDNPEEYVEFSYKAFTNRIDCDNWKHQSRELLIDSLQEVLNKRKKGYFVESLRCLRRKFPNSQKSQSTYSI